MTGRGRDIMSRSCIAAGVAIASLLGASAAPAQGLIAEHRLSATLANEAVGEAVAACARNGYALTALVVGMDGGRHGGLRGDGGPGPYVGSAHAKGYPAASP